ncbi:YciI family protein [Cellulomonas hominis]|uniref:YciI family protein n=1 Tax=Cellulomonas hominis TaxID=156981 RepID=UPI001BA395AA|nr:YciI family protein [Cellulomonas hominis]VTR76971.1 hypothetical protein CHMI_01739 [Cellulomonas hominis]
MSKYMLIMRGTDEGVAAYQDTDFREVIAAMGRYNESMMQAGVLVAGEGLSDAAEGAVVDFSGDTPVVTDGPYGETKELFNGFWTVDVATQEEAVEWAKRAPLQGPGNKIEVRRINSPEDFPQDDEWIQKEAVWREQLGTN